MGSFIRATTIAPTSLAFGSSPHHHRTHFTERKPEQLKLLAMSSAPYFWSAPIGYCRWALRERPAIFWSIVIGAAGPIAMPIVPPLRRYFGDVDAPQVPVTYPVPPGPRKVLSGFDDEEPVLSVRRPSKPAAEQ
ncbi:hypothetical protein XA68_11607 [Ophiocordyceps unilateralis]|uniref:NADH-ubiquinone oxidoreductase 9.5 kDa subunit n=1 Tax=Ophiocordyceps unilateralis TaxID=268505 RepID=A0A2A9PQ19_OPHUN|nr:hypothetical protein XA68_11607 [Ophiocordyceps unilateralis]